MGFVVAFNHPPKMPSWFLSWALPQELHDAVMGDLIEEYQEQVANSGLIKGQIWYWRQALLSAVAFIQQTQRGFIMFLISLLIFIAVTFMGMELGFETSAYIDVPSVILVVLPAVFFSIAITSISDLKNGGIMLLSDKAEFSTLQLLLAKQSFHVLGNTALLMGVFSSLLGAIAIASNLSAEEFSSVFGPAVGVCLLTLYYGLAIKIICYVAEQKIHNKQLQQESA